MSEMQTTANRIGTVEILRERVYPLDPNSLDPQRTEVYVKPGVYDLYREGAETFWLMRGRINHRDSSFESLGGGMFAARAWDSPSGKVVEFSSPRFSPVRWADLLTEPGFTEGHPEQRLRVTLTTEVSQS